MCFSLAIRYFFTIERFLVAQMISPPVLVSADAGWKMPAACLSFVIHIKSVLKAILLKKTDAASLDNGSADAGKDKNVSEKPAKWTINKTIPDIEGEIKNLLINTHRTTGSVDDGNLAETFPT